MHTAATVVWLWGIDCWILLASRPVKRVDNVMDVPGHCLQSVGSNHRLREISAWSNILSHGRFLHHQWVLPQLVLSVHQVDIIQSPQSSGRIWTRSFGYCTSFLSNLSLSIILVSKRVQVPCTASEESPCTTASMHSSEL